MIIFQIHKLSKIIFAPFTFKFYIVNQGYIIWLFLYSSMSLKMNAFVICKNLSHSIITFIYKFNIQEGCASAPIYHKSFISNLKFPFCNYPKQCLPLTGKRIRKISNSLNQHFFCRSVLSLFKQCFRNFLEFRSCYWKIFHKM